MATCGEAEIRLLEQYGVDTVFGTPGVPTLEYYRGLADSPIRHVTPRHEQGAGYMACGYARVTGGHGLCGDVLCCTRFPAHEKRITLRAPRALVTG